MNYWPHDAHMHLPISRKIACVVNASSVEEYQFLKEHKHSNMYISCGVHPWKADKTDYEVLLPYMKEADFLGEIGLDEPWCDVPFEVQKEVLIKQLQDVNKTTYLHTKGYEKEILQIITLFPRKYVVHWYSSEDYIEEYMKLDCYFTIGPIVNETLVKKVPLNRLLIETDGIEAIEWAYERTVLDTEYIDVLENIVKQVAELKKVSIEEVKLNLSHNFSALTCI